MGGSRSIDDDEARGGLSQTRSYTRSSLLEKELRQSSFGPENDLNRLSGTLLRAGRKYTRTPGIRLHDCWHPL